MHSYLELTGGKFWTIIYGKINKKITVYSRFKKVIFETKSKTLCSLLITSYNFCILRWRNIETKSTDSWISCCSCVRLWRRVSTPCVSRGIQFDST